MSVSIEDTQTQAATAHQCRRDADGVDEGGWSNYPSDPQRTALQKKKFYVSHSEDRDRTAEETSDSEAPRPISSRTRSRSMAKMNKRAIVQGEDVTDGDENTVAYSGHELPDHSNFQITPVSNFRITGAYSGHELPDHSNFQIAATSRSLLLPDHSNFQITLTSRTLQLPNDSHFLCA